MRKRFFLYLMLCICVLFVACHKEETNYHTNAIVALNFPDSVEVVRLQGTIVLTNLNNKQSYSTSNISQSTTIFSLLKGAYSLFGEGIVHYKNKAGKEFIRYFRTSENYCEIINPPTLISTPIIWL